MRYKTPLRWLLLILCTGLYAAQASAAVFVIVHHDSRVTELSKQQIRDLYFGRSRALPSGDFPKLFDQAKDSTIRQEFYQRVANLPIAQVDTYWARLEFSGRVLPPQPLSDNETVIRALKRNSSAIGYVSAPPNDPAVRVILILQDD